MNFIKHILSKLTFWDLVSMMSLTSQTLWFFVALDSHGDEVRTAMIRSDIHFVCLLISIIGGQLERRK